MDGKREINNKGAIYSMRPKVHKIYLQEYGKYNGHSSYRIPQMMKVENQRKFDHQLAILLVVFGKFAKLHLPT